MLPWPGHLAHMPPLGFAIWVTFCAVALAVSCLSRRACLLPTSVTEVCCELEQEGWGALVEVRYNLTHGMPQAQHPFASWLPWAVCRVGTG